MAFFLHEQLQYDISVFLHILFTQIWHLIFGIYMNVRNVILNNQILEIISKEMTSNTEKMLFCHENNAKKIKSGNTNTKHLNSLQSFSC